MPSPNFSLSQITDRIMLTLPAKFSRETTSNVYKFFQALGDAFILNSLQVDELFKQTSLTAASGDYVDDYIGGLSGLGRYPSGTVYLDNDETDANYKLRYKRTIFRYNTTKNGLKQIVIDMVGNEPEDMYTGNKRGAYANGRYYYNSGSMAVWGSGTNNPFVGYIEFSRKPNYWIINELRKTINLCRGYGIKIYLKYPQDDDLDIVFVDGEFERTEYA